MSPEAQRIAMAEACGWRAEKREAGGWTCYNRHGAYGDFAGTRDAAFTLNAPDYLADLNAMHKAVMDQSDETKWVIFVNLAPLVDEKLPIACANADQWAEAFLRTLHKWDDAK